MFIRRILFFRFLVGLFEIIYSEKVGTREYGHIQAVIGGQRKAAISGTERHVRSLVEGTPAIDGTFTAPILYFIAEGQGGGLFIRHEIAVIFTGYRIIRKEDIGAVLLNESAIIEFVLIGIETFFLAHRRRIAALDEPVFLRPSF